MPNKAWEPVDADAFKKTYFAGATDDELSRLFASTTDKVSKYISRSELPRRGTFSITDIVGELNDSESFDLALLKRLKHAHLSMDIVGLADEFDVSPKRLREAISRLQGQHVLATIENGAVKFGAPSTGGRSLIDLEDYNGSSFKFGIVSDCHLGSKYERLDVLHALYDLFEKEGITQVLLPGNYIEGEARFNKHDIHVTGLGKQVQYFVTNFPKRDGIVTHFIDGDDHEGWYTQREGINIGQYTQHVAESAGRFDLKCHGYMEADMVFAAPEGETIVRMQHPGGGSSYAVSYKSQKIVESLTGGEKPHILLIGHYHKSEYIHYRNIHVFQAGTTQDQSPFMRKKQLSAHVGGWIVEAFQSKDGSVPRVKMEWINFYDKAHYAKKWEYQR